ncbi:hypothetical protein Fmac_007806 [Flemingia macrophylla]|uniref:Uncharacterized protein n=1 Tax=Flemingia macrophylla TaxID=520843 RepID=A0ABD1MVK7_9FABA
MECVVQGIIETQNSSSSEVITHIESKPVDSVIVHCLVGFFKDELGLIPSAFTFAADNTVPGCWLVFPYLLCV